MTFFGREDELERLERAFSGGARLVTVVGPAGMGKTSLARALIEARRAPVLVDLARARSASTLLSGLARSLDLRPGSSSTRNVERVLEALEGRSLLCLDNAEHALDQVAELVPALTGVVPVLVTSREGLRVPGETVLELGPLSHESRIAMLLERTIAARAGVPPSAEEAALLVEIATDLEGIPLALELAGSRLGVMSASTFSSKLQGRFELLVSSRRSVDPRHRTLRAALDASYELLPTDQQRALRFVSVGAGFDLPAAEAILAPVLSAVEVASALEELHQKSWLVRRLGGPEVRFELYETLRRYAAEHRDELGESQEVAERHAAYYLGLAERRVPIVERENLLAVYSQANLQPALRARAILALEETLAASESSRVHVELLEGLRSPGTTIGADLEARLAMSLAKAKDRMGDASGARAELDAARRLARRAGDRDLRIEIATSMINFGYMHGAARVALSRGRRLHRWAGPASTPRARGRFLTELGVALHMAGDRDRADERYREALAIAEAAGDLDDIGRVLACLGFLRQDLGALSEAEAAYRRALEIHDQLGHRDVRGIVLGYLGNLERRRGRYQPAEDYYLRALEDLGRIDDRQWVAVVRMDRGLLQLDHGRYDEAGRLLAQAIADLEAVGSPDMEAIARSGLAVAAAGRGEHELARRALDLAVARMPQGAARGAVVALHAGLVELEAGAEGAIAAASSAHALAAPLLESDDYVRLAAQLLERGLARHAAPTDAALFARSGAWFEMPGQGRVQLERREPLKRILTALVKARFEAPGEALSAMALGLAGWPEEKILEAAAKNRVRVAIATLRSLGLREQLLTQDDGYLLDPKVRALIA